VLEESGTLCGVSTSKDRKTILTRFEHEGLSFLGITLPQFGKDLQKAIARSQVGPDLFQGFPRKGQIPAFLYGFLSQVFDPTDGRLLNEAAPYCIRAVFQVTGMFAKMKKECSDERNQLAFANYVQNEEQVRMFDARVREFDLRRFRVFGDIIYGDLFSIWQRQVVREEIIPTHGLGTVADKLKGNFKWTQPAWPDRLEDVFPFGRYAYSSWHLYLDDIDAGVRASSPGPEIPVKVITVPKTMKTPRIIAVEPTAMQYMQQGLRRAFEKAVKVSHFGHLINYKSQLPNQEMARKGSISGSLATLDLSDASDRVSNQLVRALLHNYPVLLQAVEATRSRQADVQGYGVIRLAKFASMGSALCFPIESIVFSVISIMAIYEAYRETFKGGSDTRPIAVWLSSYLRGKVRTYGDDIIVPSEFALDVIGELESFGFKVNHSKSFWTGLYRESCGKEYFSGFDVSYVKVREELPSWHQSVSERNRSIVSTSAMRNLFYEQGYHYLCEELDQLLMEFIPYPFVGPDSPAIGRLRPEGHQTDRWDRDLQLPMVKAAVVNAKSPRSFLDGSGALMKFFSFYSELPNPDEENLLRAGRPSSLRIKTKWVRAI